MPTTRQYTFDIDTKRYLNRVNTYRSLNGLPSITNGDAVDIDNFIIGLKDLGLWNNSICWLMRSNQNVGTGSTVLSFGGYGPNRDGILSNSPTWSTNGIVSTADNQKIIASGISYEGSVSPFSCVVVTQRVGTDTTVRHYLIKNSIAVNSRTLFMSTAMSVRWWNNTINLTVGSFNFCGLSVTNTNNAVLRVDGTTAAATVGNASPWNSAPLDSEYYTIVRQSGTVANNFNVFPCHIAFFGRALSNSAMDSIRSLYKATIGKGLGLP